MFSTLKRPALALTVTAGLLAVAGPASASTWHEAARTGLKYETEVTDHVRLSTASDSHQDSPVSLVDEDLNQPDMTTREHQTQVSGPHSLSIGFTAPSEMDANANAFLPEVHDEVLARVNYEPDYIEGMQIKRNAP